MELGDRLAEDAMEIHIHQPDAIRSYKRSPGFVGSRQHPSLQRSALGSLLPETCRYDDEGANTLFLCQNLDGLRTGSARDGKDSHLRLGDILHGRIRLQTLNIGLLSVYYI